VSFGRIGAVTLIVDAAASTVKPDAGDVAAWMAEQRVFISSVMVGMTELRRLVAHAIEAEGAHPVWFENFGGRDDDAEAAYLGEVASSTIYLGVLGEKYGRLLKSRMSATYEEYQEADKQNLSVSVWVQQGINADADQLRFIEEVRLFHTTGTYQHPDDLSRSVVGRLYEMAAADLSPWVLLADLVFRARSIRDDGKNFAIDATIRNPAIVSALEALRPGDWSKKNRRLTFNGRSHLVRITSVHTTATSRSASKVTIECEQMLDTDVKTPFSLSVAGRTFAAGEVNELLVKAALFGDDVPSGVLTLGGRVDAPLQDMPSAVMSDELQRAVIRLLITDALVRSGRVARLLRLDISPQGVDGRLAEVMWEGPSGRSRGTQTHRVRGRLQMPHPAAQ
jgi:hypothetical protein